MSTKFASDQLDLGFAYVKDYGTDATAVQAAFDTGAAVVNFDGDQTYVWTEAIEVPSNTVINFNGCSITQTGNHYTFSVLGIVSARLTDITLNGPCTATASYTGTPGSQQFIHTAFADRVHLRNGIIMTGYYGAGVKFAQGSSDCSAIGCSANSVGVISFYAEGQGDNGAAAVCSDIMFHDNVVTDFNYGIELKQVQGFSIKDNIINDAQSGTTKYGILVTRDYNQGGYTDQYVPKNGVISGNVITNPDSQGWGINTTASIDIIIDSNVVKGAGYYGITGTGSHITVTNNIVEGGSQTGISCGYGDPTLGSNGADATYDKGYLTVTGNTVKEHSGLSYNFNDARSSTISDNKAISQTAGTNVYKFNDCQDSDITNNKSDDGAQSSAAFRIEDSNNSGLLYVNNTTDVADGTISLSVPSTFTGYYTKRHDGFSYSKVSFLRTTDATPANIDSLTLVTSKAWSVEQLTVVNNGSFRHNKKSAAFLNNSGGTTTLTGTETDLYEHDNGGGTAVDVVVAGAAGSIQVTGIAAQTMDWTSYTTWTRGK